MAFLGIHVPREVGRLLNKIEVPGEKVSTSEFHITLLCFEDNWPISEISKSLEAAYKVVSKCQPFLVSVEKITSFSKNPEGKIPVIGQVKSDKLMDCRQKLADSFDDHKIDFSKIHKDFKPHVTLSYADEKPSDKKIHPIEFMVNEIVLWGGDHGDDRIFVTFPLDNSEKTKNAILLQKIELFEKFAGNPLQNYLTASYERRKIER